MLATSTATTRPSSSTGAAQAWACCTSCCSSTAWLATSAAAWMAGEAFSAQDVSAATHQRGCWPCTRNSSRLNGRPAAGASSRAQAALRLIHSCAAERAWPCDATWPSKSSNRAARWLRAMRGADSANCSQPSASNTSCTVRSLCGGASATPTVPSWPSGSCSGVTINRSAPGCPSTLATWASGAAPLCWSGLRKANQRCARSGKDAGKSSWNCGSAACNATARQATPAPPRRARQASTASTKPAAGWLAGGLSAGAGPAAASGSSPRSDGKALIADRRVAGCDRVGAKASPGSARRPAGRRRHRSAGRQMI